MLKDTNVRTHGSLKITFCSRLRKRNVPKIFSYIFLVVQLFSGLDMGFSKMFNNNVQGRLQIFTLLVACTYSVTAFTPVIIWPNTYLNPILLISILEYVLNASILLYYRKYSSYDFRYHMSVISELSKLETYMLNIISIVHCIIICPFKYSLMILIKAYHIKTGIVTDDVSDCYYSFLCYLFSVLDLVSISQIITFYYVYTSIKHLKHVLLLSDHKLSFISQRYKSIVDTCERIWPLSGSLVST